LPAFAGKPAPPVQFPEAEAREMRERPPDPAIRKAITEDNNVKPEYARIRVPVLAVYRTVTMEQALNDYPPTNDQERAALNQAYASGRAILTKWERDLIAGVPSARIVELPGANLYLFLSNEADIIRELRAFAATLALRSKTRSAPSNTARPSRGQPSSPWAPVSGLSVLRIERDSLAG
jgi:hypothetical protein